jgi:hypothetical protein
MSLPNLVCPIMPGAPSSNRTPLPQAFFVQAFPSPHTKNAILCGNLHQGFKESRFGESVDDNSITTLQMPISDFVISITIGT